MECDNLALNIIKESKVYGMDRQRIKALVSALILSTLLPIVDMGTDLYTSLSLYIGGDPIWGTLVLTFMWTPSILFILNRKVSTTEL